MNKVFCISDIHGSYRGLMQCFERSKFDYENDRLICMGDVPDGYPETKQCFNELLKIKNLVYIFGNHCFWFLDYAINGNAPEIWTSQGGIATLDSYDGEIAIPLNHVDLLKNAPYYFEYDNKLFVHGGLDLNIKDITRQKPFVLMWDRDLLKTAHKWHWRAMSGSQAPVFRKFTNYDEIFVGHTTTYYYKSSKPLHFCNVWDLDTGGRFEGALTIMDINTKEYWQSDICKTLYPNFKH